MDREERIKSQKEFLIKVAYWGVWAVIVTLLVRYAGSVLLPFVLAFFVAWGLSKPVSFAAERLHIRRKLAAVVTVALFYCALAALLYLLGNRIVHLLGGVYEDITRFVSETMAPMVRTFSRWTEHVAADILTGETAGNTAPVGKMVASVSERVFDGVSDVASYLPGVCMNVLLMVIATVFMELDFPEIVRFLKRQIPGRWQKTVCDVREYLIGTMRRCARSYCVIMLITFSELSLGFLLLRIDGAFAVAAVIAVLDILPVLGTGTVLIPWAVIALASGDLRMGIGILILYLVITVVRNVAEPRLVGRQMGLSPVVMLPCMILGLRFFGIVGLFVLPFAVSLAKSLNDRGVLHIFSH